MARQIIIAVGDVHGHYEKLCSVVDNAHYTCARLFSRYAITFVFLGDYVDRGPDSHLVVAKLQAFQKRAKRLGAEFVVLKGNHEDMMVRAHDASLPKAERDKATGFWLLNGGAQTRQSYEEFGAPDDTSLAETYDAAVARACKWMDALPLSHQVGRYFFCHAGVDVMKSLDQQTAHDLMWTRREPIQEVTRWNNLHVVYGHTPTRDGRPRFGYCGTNCDTGAFGDGRPLTAVFIDPEQDHPLGYCTNYSYDFIPRP